MREKKLLTTYLLLALLGIAGAVLLLVQGALPWPQVWQGALDRFFGAGYRWNALLDERLPRLLVLLATGASLVVAGGVMQSLLQNPLAAPSVLGLHTGSDLMAIILLVGGWHQLHPWMMPLATFLGAWLVLLAVVTLWHRLPQRQFGQLILMGIAITTLLMAIQNGLLYAWRDDWPLSYAIAEWTAGSTLDRSWIHVHMQMPLTVVGLFVCWHYRNELNILTLGDEEAMNLGVDVEKVRWQLILAIGALTGGSLAAVGNIPFFGLIVPHLLRRAFGPNQRRLLPLEIATGSISLMLFDTLLRYSCLHWLTIGNLSALVGALFFLFLLHHPMGDAIGSLRQPRRWAAASWR